MRPISIIDLKMLHSYRLHFVLQKTILGMTTLSIGKVTFTKRSMTVIRNNGYLRLVKVNFDL